MVNPEVVLSENPHGILFFGPSGEKDDGAQYSMAVAAGSYVQYNKNGNKSEIVMGASHEICGTDILPDSDEVPNETVAKSIIAKDGDIVLNAENGNVKIIAKNIFFEATGSGNDGSFMVKANEAITMGSGEQMTFAGAKVCVTAATEITLNCPGKINLLGVLSKSEAVSLGSFMSAPFATLLQAISQSCK
tara:strand:+ start:2272 stop:2841 length:570 start_codon:yes stop_codon:yes gene_type:complete